MGIYFDIESAIRDSGLSLEVMDRLLGEVRDEFPDDPTMYELHVIRAIDAEASRSSPGGQWHLHQARVVEQLLYHADLEVAVEPGQAVEYLRRRQSGRVGGVSLPVDGV